MHHKLLDIGSYFTIALTLVLFVLALFLKGFTHDLLLEVGVFLVSAKLIIMSYKNSVTADEVRRELAQIRQLLEKNGNESA